MESKLQQELAKMSRDLKQEFDSHMTEMKSKLTGEFESQMSEMKSKLAAENKHLQDQVNAAENKLARMRDNHTVLVGTYTWHEMDQIAVASCTGLTGTQGFMYAVRKDCSGSPQ